MISTFDEAFGAIVAALIAAIFGYVGLVISKEQKTSEFRQAWIDSLRQEAADLVAHLNAAADGWIQRDDNPTASPLRENMLGANRAMTLIKLRLNPIEQRSINVLSLIEQAIAEFSNDNVDLDKLQNLETDFATQMQILLKEEWDRVRKGEPVFYWSKWIAAASIALLLIFLTASKF